MKIIKYLLLCFSVVITLSIFNDYIYKLTCFYNCDGDKLASLIILGFLILLTIQSFLGTIHKPFFMVLIILFFIDGFSFLLLPDYTDYIVPEKKIALLFFNILIPIIFLGYSLYRKNNRAKFSPPKVVIPIIPPSAGVPINKLIKKI